MTVMAVRSTWRMEVHPYQKQDRYNRLDGVSICLIIALLILIQPISVGGGWSKDGDLYCCDKEEVCGLKKSDCRNIPEMNEWLCPESLNVSSKIFLAEIYGKFYPLMKFSVSSQRRVFLQTKNSPTSGPTCYSLSQVERGNQQICSRLSDHLYTTMMEESSEPDVPCGFSSLLTNTLPSYNLSALQNPETWASYIIMRYQSNHPSINVTFHQADPIAGKLSRLSYNIELLQLPSHHHPGKILKTRILRHKNETGLERNVRFSNLPSGVYKVRLQLANGCYSYCPYMYSEEVTIVEKPSLGHNPENETDVEDIGHERLENATNIGNSGHERSDTLMQSFGGDNSLKVALLTGACSLLILCVFIFITIRCRLPSRCKAMASNFQKPIHIPHHLSHSPADLYEQELVKRKVFVVYTQESTSPEGSSLHEEVVRHFVNLLIAQIQVDVRTVDLCIRDIRCLKPRKWVHRQLDVCDTIVIINSASAMERVKSAYFKDIVKWSAELQNANIVDNVFDIAMEGIMARLQSGHIKDCPSRYAVVTFPHSDSVDNLIPYLSTEMNYRLMSDWHTFCMHLKDVGASSPEMLHQSYEILSSVDGIKLQEAMDNAVSHYTWSDVNNADKADSLDRHVSQVLVADMPTSQNDCHANGYCVKDEWQPSNQFDSGFDSRKSFNPTEADLQACHDNRYQPSGVFNQSESVEAVEATQKLLKTYNYKNLPDDELSLGFVPPTIWSSSETLSTNISETQRQLVLLPYHNVLREINNLPSTEEQCC